MLTLDLVQLSDVVAAGVLGGGFGQPGSMPMSAATAPGDALLDARMSAYLGGAGSQTEAANITAVTSTAGAAAHAVGGSRSQQGREGADVMRWVGTAVSGLLAGLPSGVALPHGAAFSIQVRHDVRVGMHVHLQIRRTAAMFSWGSKWALCIQVLPGTVLGHFL